MKGFKKFLFFCAVGAAALGLAAYKRVLDEEKLYADECEEFNDAFYRNTAKTCDCDKKEESVPAPEKTESEQVQKAETSKEPEEDSCV